MTRDNRKGITLIELLLAAAVMVPILFWGAIWIKGHSDFFYQNKAQLDASRMARVTMDTIAQRLRSGRASSLVISTSNAGVNSRVDFLPLTALASGTTSYAIYLANNAVMLEEYSPNGSNAQTLGTNVSSLIFTQNSQDPNVVAVSLQLLVPYGASQRMASIFLPNETIRMAESP